METNFVYGTYNVPAIADNSLSASYTVPGIISKEMVEKMLAAEGCEEVSNHKEDVYSATEEISVTHARFFGENISRVFKVLKGN